ncbi:hypothetical protein EDD38_0477 [Kitasatospora cineracea]|uniref:Uncharacterized protein n=1 Tax=Kitasatospora cineracea TaxID=88074 RepID=A0A3N4RZP4_9ACTN|nr:hypothetical protein EDD38_0477 [Kitasatospora cineracea]
MTAEAAPPGSRVSYGEAVFDHASALGTILGVEVPIRQLGCGCYWLRADVPDPATQEAMEAGLYVARLGVPFIAHASATAGRSHLQVAIHRAACRSPAGVPGARLAVAPAQP